MSEAGMTEIIVRRPNQTDCNNLLLRRMSADDFATLAGLLERIPGLQRDSLGENGVASEYVYFPETAVASVTSQSDPMRLEIGFVGREGFIGIPVVLSDGRWPATTFVQIPGTLLRMPAEAFRSAVLASPPLLGLMLRYVQAYLVQVAQTAVANGSFKVEERLARWLLMALDRVGLSEIALTHEFLAIMLGVRRPGVTVATHVLEA
jgi:CRP-like cAMP-binding protein